MVDLLPITVCVIIISVYVALLALEKAVGLFFWLKDMIIPKEENNAPESPEISPKPHIPIKGFKNENT